MLPKTKKMTKKDFSATGRSFSLSGPLFSLKILKNQDKSKFSVVVSKKISKSAVGRNTIKRRFFNAIKENMSLFDTQNTYTFFIKKEAENTKNPYISKEIRQILKK